MTPPFVLRNLDGLVHWVLISADGKEFMAQSVVGFPTPADAKADFDWWYSTN